jgi:hypothetical protein
MKSIIRVLFMMSLFLLFSNVILGQTVSDSYCKEIEKAVATPFGPAHWYHNIVFEDECWLEFDIDVKGGIGLSVKLEKGETEKVARKSLHSDIEMYRAQHFLDREKDFKFPKFAINNFWDEAYFSESYGPMMLRRKRTFITIFCSEKKILCPQIEKSLREISVLKEY